ncbi:hypothetical protein TVAG_471360 [Trichomonas vaginalis G3]|uniref:Uncharacterized protein n=1 Tax=Trichomonas vaginalis (strain ATCC PRA-98 / G3) TaxID=412133 RepID=A2FPT5_TRIV3|nr:hypothetical protein TVAGG3_0890550 [Trichomonas vaginalis G3]EAX93078.1 hypothetical protein TVAG_471360 [Trichomonas vaginalis G3]KAI5502692.1 hypothetical protein TVAGG3_0890550 [Trichomonas vaginalis G3]|eukprot:XP_001306008.1 hypothetical protein [Trichomonas vaginalis G3]
MIEFDDTSDYISESSSQQIIDKLKYQLKEANAEIERLKSEIFSFKEKLIHANSEINRLQKQNNQNSQINAEVIEFKLKLQELEKKNRSLMDENALLTQKMQQEAIFNSCSKNIEQNILPTNTTYTPKPDITSLISQQKAELEIRDRKIQNLIKENVLNKNTNLTTRSQPIKQLSNQSPSQLQIVQEFQLRERMTELQKENVILKHKCKQLSQNCKKYRNSSQNQENQNKGNQITCHNCHADEILATLLQKESYEKKIQDLEESLANEKDKTYKLMLDKSRH